MITLLTTSISRSGKPLRARCLDSHMIRSDAEAVVALPEIAERQSIGCRRTELSSEVSISAGG